MTPTKRAGEPQETHTDKVGRYFRNQSYMRKLLPRVGQGQMSAEPCSSDVLAPLQSNLVIIRSNPAHQDQDQHDYEYEAKTAAAVVAGSVEGTAAEPAKAAE
jgi:hypothetical protein